jgi:hypothetical protein
MFMEDTSFFQIWLLLAISLLKMLGKSDSFDLIVRDTDEQEKTILNSVILTLHLRQRTWIRILQGF